MSNNPNNIISSILFKNIQSSFEWNGYFDLLDKDEKNNKENIKKIDLSNWMIISLHSDWGGWKTTLVNDLIKKLKKDTYYSDCDLCIEKNNNYNTLKKNIFDRFLWNIEKWWSENNSNKKIEINSSEKNINKRKNELVTKLKQVNNLEAQNDNILNKIWDSWYKNYLIEEVNAWEFNKEKKDDLWMSIISYFYVKIIENNINELKEEKDFKSLIWKLTITNLTIFTNKLTWAILPQFKPITNLIENFSKDINKNNPITWLNKIKDNISLFYSMKEDVKKLLKKESLMKKYKKYILVIDDLDRCDPEEVIKLLDALKLFLDLPNLIVIVCVDRRHIEKWIYQVYNNKSSDSRYFINTNEYLEKIIHLPIDLFIFDDNIKFCNWEWLWWWDIDLNFEIKNNEIIQLLNNDYIKNIYNYWLSNNPRKILRFKRMVKFYYNIFNHTSIDLIDDINNQKYFIFWLVLKIEWWDYFEIISKNPILLYLPYDINDNNYENILEEYSKFFYWKNINVINHYEINKIKNLINFIVYFSNEEDKNKDDNEKTYLNIMKYFYSFQIWSDLVNDNQEIEIKTTRGTKIKFKSNYWDKLLFKNFIELLFFKNNEKTLIEKYKENIKRIYNMNISSKDDFKNNLNSIIKNNKLWILEKEIIEENFLKNNLEKDNIEFISKNKEIVNEDKIDEDNINYTQIKTNNKNELDNTWSINNNEKKVDELEEKKYSDKLSEDIPRWKSKEIFEELYESTFHDNNKKIENAFTNNMRMITWLWNIEEAREEDEKRFFLWSSLFFRHIVIKNIDSLLFFEVYGGLTNGWNQENKLKIDNMIVYNDLWEENILQNLINSKRRTLFWEIINQMSFCKSWPSLWWMTWATDYTQFEALLIDILSIIKDNNKINEVEKRFELLSLLKSTIIVNRDDKDKNIINLDNLSNFFSVNSLYNTNYENIGNYFWLMKYIDTLIYLIEDKEIQNWFEKRFRRIKKRLIYVFSHFWYLQKPNTYITYYWTSKFWFRELVDWETFLSWSVLEWSLLNYVSFCLNYYKYLDENYDKNLIDDIKNFVNIEFEKSNLYQLLYNYEVFTNKDDENKYFQKLLFKHENFINKEEEKNLAIDFIHTKILEHKLVFISRYFKWEENIF